MRLTHLAAVVLICLAAASCKMITEAMPGSPEDGLTPTPTSKPKATATPTGAAKATATSTPEPTATAAPTATVGPTQSPEVTCPDSSPGVAFVNGSNTCKSYVPATHGNCGVDSTWWFDCSDYYFLGATYQYIGGGNPWMYVGQNTNAPCFSPSKNYQIGAQVSICSTGGATSCDNDHMVNPGMIACCRNHNWTGDDRRVVVSAVDASGTALSVLGNVGGNPSFAEIVIVHPGQALTVNYCLPPPPLIDGQCGSAFPYEGTGCTTKVFTP
jgi:hypothetical protein